MTLPGIDEVDPSEVPRETRAAAEAVFGARLPLALAYAEALATSGAERGLIGPREVPRLWDRHLLNCVVLAELIPDDVELADVGSGAGLPGLPIAIARPDLSVSLVEPLLRRVVWLREVVDTLGLTNVQIIRGRSQAVAESQQSFDVVTARAVAPLVSLLELCLPLVRPGGELLAMKGENADEELAEAEGTLRQLGASEWRVMRCGDAVLSTPTTVVQVVAGARARSASGGHRKPKGGSPTRARSGTDNATSAGRTGSRSGTAGTGTSGSTGRGNRPGRKR
jgi:16S rRNA (guanine527-N7)-methyltransferase